jgi:hypothetical protein
VERLETRLTDDLKAARAQMEQYDRQKDSIEARMAAIDAEAEVVEKLAALRRRVTGEVREGIAGDLGQPRALMRRLFVGFKLASPKARFGSGTRDGQPWVGNEGEPDPLSFDGGYYLLPVLRFDAIDLDRDDPAGFPAVRRVPLSHDFLCSLLADW